MTFCAPSNSGILPCMNTPFDLDTEILTYIVYGLGIVCIVLLVLVIRLTKHMRKFLLGNKSTNLEETLAYTRTAIKTHEEFEEEMRAYLTTVESRLRNSVQHVETLRFNPFKGSGGGGNQSFATAFINEHGDGVVVSGLYSRDRMSVFAKPLKGFASEHELTTEEQEVITRAKQKKGAK